MVAWLPTAEETFLLFVFEAFWRIGFPGFRGVARHSALCICMPRINLGLSLFFPYFLWHTCHLSWTWNMTAAPYLRGWTCSPFIYLSLFRALRWREWSRSFSVLRCGRAQSSPFELVTPLEDWSLGNATGLQKSLNLPAMNPFTA